MRLLHTASLKLSEFFGTEIPPYAILSHRWSDSEVTFQDLQSGFDPRSSGWEKIVGCCKRAHQDGFDFVWIDSCCIDKSSSAELSEAINSMFRWYQGSQVCYVYLVDVIAENGPNEHDKLESEFKQSKWFTRGWTLQELLAPETLIFFNRNWVEVGTKLSLQTLISTITRIEHLFNYEQASIAQKMSWASCRETLRPEDMAYCMLGLFDVNMPLLYGEGEKAFLRLQIEIMKVSDDESIFAWKDATILTSGLLARSPSAFQHSEHVEQLPNTRTSPYLMTNKGIQIQLYLIAVPANTNRSRFQPSKRLIMDSGQDLNEQPTFVAPLCCARKNTFIPIAIQLVPLSQQTNEYSRISCHNFAYNPSIRLQPWMEKIIFVRQYEKFSMQRGQDLIQLRGTDNKTLSNLSAALYPGVFVSGHFKSSESDPYESVMSMNLVEVEAETGHPNSRKLAVELGYGIAMITLQLGNPPSNQNFVLEIDIPQEGAPGVDILIAKGPKYMQKLIHEKLNSTRSIARHELVSRNLGSGSHVVVSVVQKRHMSVLSYLIDVSIQVEARPVSPISMQSSIMSSSTGKSGR